MVTHVVLFRFRDNRAEQLEKCKARLEALPSQIPQIRHFEVGINIVPSERAWEMCLYSRFDSLDDLAAYQSHPAHLEFVEYLNSVVDTRASVDYVT